MVKQPVLGLQRTSRVDSDIKSKGFSRVIYMLDEHTADQGKDSWRYNMGDA